jgi:capsular exopolysaccharide synthesis family protein
MELLQSRPTVLREALGAAQVQPTPRRDALLGGLLGLLLGLGLPFLVNALDRRVRSEDEVERLLGIPLLARLPKPARESRVEQLSMLFKPTQASAEAIRRLRTNLELANLDGRAKLIVAASAVALEGKSTTIANLALALARSGRNVVLVDLDLRRPSLARFFGLERRPGLTDVVLGRVALSDALVPVALPIPLSMPSNGSVDQTAPRLHVLTTGPLPANPGEFVGTEAVASLLRKLGDQSDFVLIDAPPVLPVGDGLTLATVADAVIAIVRLEVTNRTMLGDFGRALARTPATKLGFVLVGTDDRATYGTSPYGAYDEPAESDAAYEPIPPLGFAKGPSRLVPELDSPSLPPVRRREAPE